MVKNKIETIQKTIAPHFPTFKKKYHVKRMGIFGSVARGTNKKGSDLDILVEFDSPIGFFQFIRLEKFLEKVTGRKVDLVSKKALKPFAKKEVLKEVLYLHEKKH